MVAQQSASSAVGQMVAERTNNTTTSTQPGESHCHDTVTNHANLNQQREALMSAKWAVRNGVLHWAMRFTCFTRRALLSASASLNLCCSTSVSVLLGAAASIDCHSSAETIEGCRCTLPSSEYASHLGQQQSLAAAASQVARSLAATLTTAA